MHLGRFRRRHPHSGAIPEGQARHLRQCGCLPSGGQGVGQRDDAVFGVEEQYVVHAVVAGEALGRDERDVRSTEYHWCSGIPGPDGPCDLEGVVVALRHRGDADQVRPQVVEPRYQSLGGITFERKINMDHVVACTFQ